MYCPRGQSRLQGQQHQKTKQNKQTNKKQNKKTKKQKQKLREDHCAGWTKSNGKPLL